MENKQTPDWEELPFSEPEMQPLIQELDFQSEQSLDPVPDESEMISPVPEEPLIEELPMEAPASEEYTQLEEASFSSLYPQDDDAFTVAAPEEEDASEDAATVKASSSCG